MDEVLSVVKSMEIESRRWLPGAGARRENREFVFLGNEVLEMDRRVLEVDGVVVAQNVNIRHATKLYTET